MKKGTVTHWCWMAPRQRVQVVGSPLNCERCRRFNSKHKCGAVSSASSAWRNYPVSDCAACAPTLPTGVFSEGPSSDSPAIVDPKKDLTAATIQKAARVKATGIRKDTARRRAKRMRLICVVVTLKTCCNRDIRQILTFFGITVTRELLNRDLNQLVKERWLIRNKVNRKSAPRYQSKVEYTYTLSTSIRGKINELCTSRM